MKIRVLIADDHLLFRSGLAALLGRSEDVEVVGEVDHGDRVLEGVLRLEPDVTLLDLSMPGPGGPVVLERLLRERPAARVVVLTMHEDPSYVREMLRRGALGYVLKRASVEDVVRAVLAAARGERFVDPALAGLLLAPRAPSQAERPVEVLTQREREVLTLLALGHTNAEVGAQLGISERTVETHRTSVVGKLGFQSRAQLVRYALERGWVR